MDSDTLVVESRMYNGGADTLIGRAARTVYVTLVYYIGSKDLGAL